MRVERRAADAAAIENVLLTKLRTETRVACYGRAAKLLFAAYRGVVRPFSGLIRKEMLKQVHDQARSG